MPALECPDVQGWQALFSGSLSSEERERYEKHLETCAACQERLDRADDERDGLLDIVRDVGKEASAPRDSTLIQVLDRLRHTPPPSQPGRTEPLDLFFLQPSDRPEVLGTLGQYEVQEVIGQGGMGVVLKALDPALHRLVAIKVMAAAVAGSATARKRFIREAKAAAAVSHDHIVTVHGVAEADGLPYLVMQYIAGESLQERIDRTGPLDVIDIVRIGYQMASGLAAAHAQGLIHRDIKPANILLENGLARVRITDFGLARMVDDMQQLTQHGVVTGTPEYMSPEQARGEPVDHRADLFSLGSVIYAMCTGRPPYSGASTVAVLRKVSDQAPQPIRALNPEIPAWLEQVVERLLAKNPSDRFQSAAEVAALLESYLAHLRQPATVSEPKLPPPLPPGRTGRIPWRRTRRRWLLAMACGAAAALFLAGAGLLIGLRLGTIDHAGGAGQTMGAKFERVFGNDPSAGKGLVLTGPHAKECVRFEERGLRIDLPREYDGPPGFFGERPDTGIIVPLGIKGDFEITVVYEILSKPLSKDAGHPQTRFTLDVAVDRTNHLETTLSHRVVPWGGDRYLAWMRDDKLEGQPTRETDIPVRGVSKGRLRMIRQGDTLAYLFARDPAGPFQVLNTFQFSKDEIEDVRLVGSTGGKQAALDVLVTEVSIRAEELVDRAAPLAPNTGLRIAVAAGAVAILAAAVTVRWLRRRRLPSPPSHEETTRSAAIVFTCAACGKNLKTRPELAGKRVKCPGCGQATDVPMDNVGAV